MDIGDEYGDFVVCGAIFKRHFKHANGTYSGIPYVPLVCKKGCGNEKTTQISVIRQGRSKTCKCNPKAIQQRLAAVEKARTVKRRRANSDDGSCGFLDDWFAKIQQEAQQKMAIKQMKRV